MDGWVVVLPCKYACGTTQARCVSWKDGMWYSTCGRCVTKHVPAPSYIGSPCPSRCVAGSTLLNDMFDIRMAGVSWSALRSFVYASAPAIATTTSTTIKTQIHQSDEPAASSSDLLASTDEPSPLVTGARSGVVVMLRASGVSAPHTHLSHPVTFGASLAVCSPVCTTTPSV